MGKRTLDDVSNGVEKTGSVSESRASKKSRKEERKSGRSDVKTDEKALKKQRREGKRLRKLRKAATDLEISAKHIAVETNRHAMEVEEIKAMEVRPKKKMAKKDHTSVPAPVTPTDKESQQKPPSNGHVSASGYVEEPALAHLPQSDIDAYLSEHFITISDPKSAFAPLRPITAFAHLPNKNTIPGNPFQGFSSPTPIQAAAWPFLLSGRDVVGVAETGSGKTLAFAVPCIRYIQSLGGDQPGKRARGVRALIVSPTRELAMQIHEQVVKLATPAGLGAVCVYGGVSKDEQRTALRTASIVIATPGRLNDLINEGVADLSKVGYVVLDEADRMLDKGFEDEIRKIISTTPGPSKRQTLMFTATWPPSVRDLAGTFMISPIKIAIGDNNPSGDLRANGRITQSVEVLDPQAKQARLLALLKTYQAGPLRNDRILVFCLYKKEATRIEALLRARTALRVASIHGDLSQAQRTASLGAFKSGAATVLVATDVAARGLDIPAVKLVLNLTFPLTVEDYVHRIGRTGRAGQPGTAITLFTEHDKALSGALINVLRAANQPVPPDLLKFGGAVKKRTHEAYGNFYKAPEAGEVKAAVKIKFDD
ncbi:MAG: RNA-dependent ATPase [Thelocarpon superellum]|nr:MAG: RNA-dependent ATPase [Thelocarpon superellum]